MGDLGTLRLEATTQSYWQPCNLTLTDSAFFLETTGCVFVCFWSAVEAVHTSSSSLLLLLLKSLIVP